MKKNHLPRHTHCTSPYKHYQPCKLLHEQSLHLIYCTFRASFPSKHKSAGSIECVHHFKKQHREECLVPLRSQISKLLFHWRKCGSKKKYKGALSCIMRKHKMTTLCKGVSSQLFFQVLLLFSSTRKVLQVHHVTYFIYYLQSTLQILSCMSC